MDFTHFTIMQDGSAIGSSAALPQAVATATHHAADTGRPVTVMAHVVGGGARRAVFNPDGANEHIWDIDKGRPLTPTVRQVYMNRSGGRYRYRLCRSQHQSDGISHKFTAGCYPIPLGVGICCKNSDRSQNRIQCYRHTQALVY